MSTVLLLHCVSKNDTSLCCYNSDSHKRILIIFGRIFPEKIENQNLVYFPLHLTNVSALPCETGNPENACVYLNAVLCLTCFDDRHTKHVQIAT